MRSGRGRESAAHSSKSNSPDWCYSHEQACGWDSQGETDSSAKGSGGDQRVYSISQRKTAASVGTIKSPTHFAFHLWQKSSSTSQPTPGAFVQHSFNGSMVAQKCCRKSKKSNFSALRHTRPSLARISAPQTKKRRKQRRLFSLGVLQYVIALLAVKIEPII